MSRLMFGHALALLLCAACLQGARAQERMQPGLWEIETVRDPAQGGGGAMPGFPAQRRCIDAAEAAGTSGTVDDIARAMAAQAPECKVEAVTAEGAHVTFRLSCDGLSQTGDFRYGGTMMEGRILMTMPGQTPMALIQRGRRTGPCP